MLLVNSVLAIRNQHCFIHFSVWVRYDEDEDENNEEEEEEAEDDE